MGVAVRIVSLGGYPSNLCSIFTSLKTSVFALPFCENRLIVRLFLTILYHNMTDSRTVKTIPTTMLSTDDAL